MWPWRSSTIATESLVYSKVNSIVQNEAVARRLGAGMFSESVDASTQLRRNPRLTVQLGVSRRTQSGPRLSPFTREPTGTQAASIEDNPGFRIDVQLRKPSCTIRPLGRLRAAFNRLSLNQRTVLELAFEEGLSHTEVAHRLQRPLGTVGKTQMRLASKSAR